MWMARMKRNSENNFSTFKGTKSHDELDFDRSFHARLIRDTFEGRGQR